ncbi:MAG: sulfate/molybdate ABC transporter ATP-binding protein [Moraxella sp.]
MSITVSQIYKQFNNFHVLKNINLDIDTGELAVLLGPSGCGKTTLLRIIAGLENADSGEIFFDKINVTHIPVQQRGIGFVFQNYALFRHKTVFDNIAFGLTLLKKRPTKEKIAQKVDELLEMVQLPHVKQRYPHELSGGQRQRVALARALAIRPKLLLLDEPFGALDTKVRKELRTSLKNIQKETGVTGILVTHDQEEAAAIADKIIVMNDGAIEQVGSSDILLG